MPKYSVRFSPKGFQNAVITGFNTDVEHEGVTYHVQTEDKGLETPLILSLVYNRGTILASKRVPYDDLLKNNFDEKELAVRLQKQHKTICAAVRAGRIEELKQMTAKDSAKKRAQRIGSEIKKPEPILEVKATQIELDRKISVINKEMPAPKPVFTQNLVNAEQKIPKKTITAQPELNPADSRKIADRIDQAKAQNAPPARITQPLRPPITETKIAVEAPPQVPEPIVEKVIPKPNQELVLSIPMKVYEEELITGNFEIIEEEPIIEAVQILTDFAKPELPKSDKLQVELMTETLFKGGDRKTVSIFVHRGNMEKGIGEAQIMVKVLGSSFRPLIFHAKTDSNGVATVHLQLPHFRSGRAAILIRAISGSEESELRRVVAHG